MTKQRDHIHTVIVSYNRIELTQQALRTYKRTVSIPHSYIVVDNGSDERTIKWLYTNLATRNLLLLGENRYPGFATNRGWELAPPETTMFHRADNDFAFQPGWCEQVLAVLENPSVGQVGLRTDAEEVWNPYNVGGNCVIRRKLWEKGLRYDERHWGDGYDPGWTEDSLLSPAVVKMGWRWARVQEPCIVSLSREDPDDPDYSYYLETWRVRGMKPPA